MRVLELRQSLRYGGLERLIVSSGALLQADGLAIDVMVLYNRSRAGLLGEDAASLPAEHPLVQSAGEYGLRAWQALDGHILSPRPLAAIMQALSKQRYDLIHSHDFKSDVLGLLAGRLSGVPVIATAHGYPRAVRRNDVYRRLDLLALRLFPHVVCVSHSLRQELLAGGLRPERLTVIHNGISVPDMDRKAARGRDALRAELGLAVDDLLVLAVGRLSAEKGHAWLLDALALAVRRQPRLRLAIVGDGPLRRDLLMQAQRLGISHRVRLLGYRADVPRLLAAGDIVANPSLSEAFGNAILEAMALSRPVIAARAGGQQEIVADSETGLLVAPGEVAALADALALLAERPDIARRMGEQARLRALSHFTVERVAEQLAGLYWRHGRSSVEGQRAELSAAR